MGTIPKDNIERVKKWYSEGDSMREIGEKLGVTLNAVIYFFRKHKILRRSLSEVSRVLFERKPMSFKIKSKLTNKERMLKIVAIMLYWGEGTKRGHSVDLANSDKDMVLIFLRFLREICQVDEKRLRVLLYCYGNQNSEKLIKYWSRITKISVRQFIKPYVRGDYSMVHSRAMEYGLVHIRYSDLKLLRYIIEEKQKYIKDNV